MAAAIILYSSIISIYQGEIMNQTDINFLIEQNQGLVHWTARKYLWTGISYEDLVQASFEGMTKAAHKFDPSRGVKFTTYAFWWMRQAVQRVKKQDDTHLSLDKTIGSDNGTSHLDNVTESMFNGKTHSPKIESKQKRKTLLTLTSKEQRILAAKLGHQEPPTFSEIEARLCEIESKSLKRSV
jgi:RNA polymerase sigma factor (sigma-70 family)